MLISDFLARAAVYYRESPKDQEIPAEGCVGMGLFYRPSTATMQAVIAVDEWGSEGFDDLLTAILHDLREAPTETRH